eukprot:g12027.t1
MPPVVGAPRALLAAHALLAATTLAANYVTVPVYTHLMMVVLLTIYIGCLKSVTRLTPQYVGGEPASEAIESMKRNDVYMMPVLGSGVLLSLYLVYKYLPAEYINLVIRAYCLLFGLAVLCEQIDWLLAAVLPSTLTQALTAPGVTWTIALPYVPLLNPAPPPPQPGQQAPPPRTLSVTPLLILALMISAAICVWYLRTNHWAANNVLGIAFSIQGIESLSLGTFTNGAILLAGLFFYDVFWVFGTDVMVTVAKSFDGPIKLLFPRPFGSPNLLGLGDICIPGFFLAMLLRFDLKHERHATAPYFWTSFFSYFLGLSTTLFVMNYFNAAQPALLYLVPALLLASLGTGLVRMEISTLVSYSEEEEEEDKAVADKSAAAAPTQPPANEPNGKQKSKPE